MGHGEGLFASSTGWAVISDAWAMQPTLPTHSVCCVKGKDVHAQRLSTHDVCCVKGEDGIPVGEAHAAGEWLEGCGRGRRAGVADRVSWGQGSAGEGLCIER